MFVKFHFPFHILNSLAFALTIGCQIHIPDLPTDKHVHGNGVVITEERSIDDFDSLKVPGNIQVEIYPGQDPSLTITGEENILAIVETKTEDGDLIIRANGSYSSTSPIVIKTSCSKLLRYTGQGVTQGTIQELTSPSLEVELTGSSSLVVQSGRVDILKAHVSGVSNLNAENLFATKAKAEASGSSKITLRASEDLDANASGVSSILYYGSPNSKQFNTSGVASIQAATNK